MASRRKNSRENARRDRGGVGGSYPSHLWGRNERRPLRLIPPPAKRWGGWHVVSGANEVSGGGVFRERGICAWQYAIVPPTRRFAPPSPQRGRDRKERAMTVHKRIAALSSLSLRTVQWHRGSYPSHLWVTKGGGIRRS